MWIPEEEDKNRKWKLLIQKNDLKYPKFDERNLWHKCSVSTRVNRKKPVFIVVKNATYALIV
jgi:hypothetical protein